MTRLNRTKNGYVVSFVTQNLSTQFTMDLACFKIVSCPTQDLVLHTLRYCLSQGYFFFSFLFTFFSPVPFFFHFFRLQDVQ